MQGVQCMHKHHKPVVPRGTRGMHGVYRLYLMNTYTYTHTETGNSCLAQTICLDHPKTYPSSIWAPTLALAICCSSWPTASVTWEAAAAMQVPSPRPSNCFYISLWTPLSEFKRSEGQTRTEEMDKKWLICDFWSNKRSSSLVTYSLFLGFMVSRA